MHISASSKRERGKTEGRMKYSKEKIEGKVGIR